MATKQYLDYAGLEEVATKVNSRLKTVTEMPASASDGAVRLYVGETDVYSKGHYYQYSETDEEWLDITPSASGGGWDVVTTMPSTGALNQVVLFNGHSTSQYAHGGLYQYYNSQWNFLGALVQLIEVPFTLTLDSITAISSGDTSRVLTFTSSEETVITEETFNGVTANGVIQGKFWNDIGGSISQIDETTFQVELDTNVTDSLGQLAQFPSGSSITIPGFSWIDGITRYIHNAETITISETVVSQKLAFNTTGTLDTSTQATVFGISSAYEVPFVLSYQNIPTVTMLDSNYENEVTQSWTPSIVAANDATNLVFTPTTSTALHGDNIAVTSGTLTAVANGVTYTYNFSTDNINLRWGNTTWSFGTYNTFASFTAAPTSANTGSVTCTLNPTGPGATARELAFMANLLPTVTIADSGETKEFSTVAWTQGSIVASGATGVTSVANKLITITWDNDSTTDVDSYGITCSVYVSALSLSATCAYIDHNVTLSTPTMSHTAGDSDVSVNLVASESLPNTLFADYTEVTLRARAVLQGRLITSNATANATASGTTFTINDLPDLVDTLDQRALFATGSTVIVGAFEYIDGDDKYIHASQTINVTETLTTQKLAFNATGTIDSSTGVTTFTINASTIVPFVLSTSDTFTATMLAAGYGSETTVTWTPTVSYGDSDTELLFTPDVTTALHGDNITFANKVLNFTSNGVTYEIDTSEDTLNVRWANTSYDFGTYNNFASFTAVPTSANSGSVTCTLNPTGPGDDAFELAFMAANLPTVYIDSTECSTVAWTEGSIVASGASGITTVGGKTIDIVWSAGDDSDVDSYGITRIVHFVAKSLSVTCGYITKTIVLSSPTPSVSNNVLTMSFATDVSTSDAITIPSTDYTSSAYGILQAETTTITADGSASYSGNTFSINSFAGGVDRLGQRMVFNSTAGSVTVGTFDFASGDYEVIHASQTISYQDSSISEQSLDMNGPMVSISWAGNEPTMSNVLNLVIDSSLTYVSGGTSWGTYSLDCDDLIFFEDEFDYETNQVRTGYVQSGYTITISSLPNAGLYIGNKSATLALVSGKTNATWTKDGITWYIGDQRFSLPGKLTSMISVDFRNATDMTSYYEEFALSKCHINFSSSVPVPRVITLFVFYNYVFKNGRTVVSNSRGTVSWPQQLNSGSYDVVYGSNLIEVTANSSTLESDYENTPWGMDGTVTCTLPEINETVRYSSDTPILQVISEASTTITGAHTFSYYFDDDDCDDD